MNSASSSVLPVLVRISPTDTRRYLLEETCHKHSQITDNTSEYFHFDHDISKTTQKTVKRTTAYKTYPIQSKYEQFNFKAKSKNHMIFPLCLKSRLYGHRVIINNY